MSLKDQQVDYQTKIRQQSTMFLKEKSEQGHVKFQVYMEYLEAASKWGVLAFILCTFAQQGFTICKLYQLLSVTQVRPLTMSPVSNLALRAWGETNQVADNDVAPGPYLLRYGLFILAAALSSFAAGVLLWVYCAVRSARRLHDAACIFPLRKVGQQAHIVT